MSTITTLAELRALYPQPGERALKKEIPALERHSLRFIALSPFVVVASHGADGSLDASPRGGAPGFVKATADGQLLLPDSPGNHRLDTLRNICLLYTSDAADDMQCVDLGGRRIIKKPSG